MTWVTITKELTQWSPFCCCYYCNLCTHKAGALPCASQWWNVKYSTQTCHMSFNAAHWRKPRIVVGVWLTGTNVATNSEMRQYEYHFFHTLFGGVPLSGFSPDDKHSVLSWNCLLQPFTGYRQHSVVFWYEDFRLGLPEAFSDRRKDDDEGRSHPFNQSFSGKYILVS